MRVLILGAGGYIGNALLGYLEGRYYRYTVRGVDNWWRYKAARSATPVNRLKIDFLDVRDYEDLVQCLREFSPHAVVHLAEQPSAPYSMRGAEEASFTLRNNLTTTSNLLWAVREVDPNVRVLKLGTAGEYSDWLYPPEIEIPERDRIMVEYLGERWKIPTPRYFSSIYHASKVFDSLLCDYCARVWNLSITDINQAPVYGHWEGTRFDYDECFGTVVNRFIAQAITGHPLTVYGTGGQSRGFIHLENALEAMELLLRNPAEYGEFRVIHQLTEVRTVWSVAELVSRVTGAEVRCIPNPRVEMEGNHFRFEKKALGSLGLKPIYMTERTVMGLYSQILPYADNIVPDRQGPPTIRWNDDDGGIGGGV